MIDEAPVHQAALCRHGLLTRTQLRKFVISPAMECRRVARGRCWAWLVVLRAVVDQRFEQPGTAGDMEFLFPEILEGTSFQPPPSQRKFQWGRVDFMWDDARINRHATGKWAPPTPAWPAVPVSDPTATR